MYEERSLFLNAICLFQVPSISTSEVSSGITINSLPLNPYCGCLLGVHSPFIVSYYYVCVACIMSSFVTNASKSLEAFRKSKDYSQEERLLASSGYLSKIGENIIDSLIRKLACNFSQKQELEQKYMQVKSTLYGFLRKSVQVDARVLNECAGHAFLQKKMELLGSLQALLAMSFMEVSELDIDETSRFSEYSMRSQESRQKGEVRKEPDIRQPPMASKHSIEHSMSTRSSQKQSVSGESKHLQTFTESDVSMDMYKNGVDASSIPKVKPERQNFSGSLRLEGLGVEDEIIEDYLKKVKDYRTQVSYISQHLKTSNAVYRIEEVGKMYRAICTVEIPATQANEFRKNRYQERSSEQSTKDLARNDAARRLLFDLYRDNPNKWREFVKIKEKKSLVY